MNDFLFSMILTELEDAVGKENCSVKQIDKLSHSVDYYWLSRMWADRSEGCRRQILWWHPRMPRKPPRF